MIREILEPVTKGSTLRTTLAFIRERFGPGALAEVLRRIPEESRRSVEEAAPKAEVPFALMSELLDAAQEVLGPEDPRWVEESGAFSIDSSGLQLYAGILRKSSPLEFLTQPVSLFRLYYHPGNMEVVEHAAGRAVLRLVGFDHRNRLFCRRQTGGLVRALELAGGRDPSTRHVRCALEGDAFCEWELRWETP
jgi:hypothetical protein